MDFAILLLVGRLLKLSYRIWRIVLGSISGALGACIELVFNGIPSVLRFVLLYVAVALAMVVISYGKQGLNRLFYVLVALYAQTVFLGGILQFLFSMIQKSRLVQGHSISNNGQSVNFVIMILIVLILLLVSPPVFRYINELRTRLKTVFTVTLLMEEKSVAVKGLLDTGNHLRDPITNKPVIIVEQAVVEEILTKNLMEYYTRIKLVPYRSIGKDNGTMCGIVLDEIQVQINGEQHIHKNVIACMYKGTLSSSKEYQVILHEELI